MNAKRLVLLSAGLLILSGCAATKSPTAEGGSSSYYDQDYIGAVNDLAKKSRVQVYWINPPRVPAGNKSGE